MNPMYEDCHVLRDTRIGEFHSLVHQTGEEFCIAEATVAEIQSETLSRPLPKVNLGNSALDPEQQQQLETLLLKYSDVFSAHEHDYGHTDRVRHAIRTGSAQAIRQRAYHTSHHMRAELGRQVQQLLDGDIIEESCSLWSSPVVLVKKKDGSYRFCIDFPFLLYIDASQDCIGSVLAQVQEQKERLIAYASHTLTLSQRKWSTYDRELWAIVWSVRDFKHQYLAGTLQRARRICYWPYMSCDIHKFCSECLPCQTCSFPTPRERAHLQSIHANCPFQSIAADITKLPITSKGHWYVLVIMDYFTCYITLFPLKDQRAMTVAQCIFEEYIRHHGIPETIHTDQGRQFDSDLMKQLCKMLGKPAHLHITRNPMA
ncbi:hypothetical protein AOLI_G00062990 [Acnodon oligacanthus]